MDAAVHAIDGEAHAVAKLVPGELLVPDLADDAGLRLVAVKLVVRNRSRLRQSVALQRLVHGLDDVAALVERA